MLHTSYERKLMYLTIIPTSVIDIGKQSKRIIEKDHHNNKSSRSGFSPFPDEINTLCYEFFLKDCTQVFDPFAGWGERAAKAKEVGIPYYGIDTSATALKIANDYYDVTNHLGNALTYKYPKFDGVLTCPPYFNLEKYESEKGIDRHKKWSEFLTDYETIMKRLVDGADDGCTFCIMVGNWRKAGVYYDLQFETDRILKGYGLTIIDKIVVSRKKVSKIKIMLPQCKRLGYSVNLHEYLLIYRKIK